MEQIAMDMGSLLISQFPALARRADELREPGLVTRMRAGGRVLYEELGVDAATAGAEWASDTVRGWAAMAIGQAPALGLDERLQMMRTFADDHHFAVREWAWLSIRPHVANDARGAIAALTPWASEDSERLRRFATEATRPRGVWSVHLPVLKAEPHLGLPLLEPVRADPSRYVQDSVGNWLNDASKSRPEWVRSVCVRWLSQADTPSTRRICRRGSRSLEGD
jgi:3-methyladenine DNA glycosylase AlkC